jgi:hypothetical protein
MIRFSLSRELIAIKSVSSAENASGRRYAEEEVQTSELEPSRAPIRKVDTPFSD